MKKYIYIITILAIGFLSSCNDDIPIDELKQSFDVSFQLDPGTIAEPFEYTRYDIERADYSRLHLRLLIYNEEDGKLVASSDTLINSYLVKPNLSLNLQEGNYIAVALSNEKLNYDGYEYWTLSGAQTLSTLGLTKDNDTKWDNWNNLTGFANMRINVSKNGVVNSMELKPLGAIFWIIYDGIHAWGNRLTQMRFDADRQETSVHFDNVMNPKYSFNMSDNIRSYFVYDYINVDDEEDNYAIHGLCVSPMDEFKMIYFCTLDGNDNVNLGNGMRISDVEAGKEYYAYIRLSTEDNNLYYSNSYGFLKDLLNEETNVLSIEQSSLTHNLIKNKDLNLVKSKYTIKVQDLIK